MTDEERDIITRFIARMGGGGGSVPGTAPALPPVDPAADALIGDLFTRHPEARYRITQAAFVQEHALNEAQNRIQALEWQVQQARAATQQAASSSPWGQQAQPARGLFGSLFGGQPQNPPPQPAYAPPPPPPPPPQYAPGYQPGMFQRGGSGFLGSALTTAAGVAGGMVAGNALMNLFSPHSAQAGGFGGFGNSFGGQTPIDQGANPWGTDASAGGSPDPTGSPDPGAYDPGTDPSLSDPGLSDPGSSDPGGSDSGWDSGTDDDLTNV